VSSLAPHGPCRSDARSPTPLRYKLGSPIHIAWTAPPGHSRKDWIGMYRVIDVDDRDVTKITSRGRWMRVCPAEYDDGRSAGIIAVDEIETGAQGEVMFSVNVLVWKCGVYEARYHHDG
jgi:phosphatidylethanolamine N-methyltransferase